MNKKILTLRKISVAFTDDELSCIDSSLSVIVKEKTVNLTPKQRQIYGRVACYMKEDPAFLQFLSRQSGLKETRRTASLCI
jgi:hypothetical protein